LTSTYEAIIYEDPDADGVARITPHCPDRLNAACRARREPEFAMRVLDDLPAAYPWWQPDEWSS